MLDEISAAVIFLARLIEKSENFNQEQLEDFKARLSELLVERFENHWFPEQPCKGQGYRCIRVNERDPRDATLERAAIACGIKYEDLKLPVELTIWVDPNEVCCRNLYLFPSSDDVRLMSEDGNKRRFPKRVKFGEHGGSYCTLASFSDKENVNLIDKQLEKIEDLAKESKLQMIPLSSSNQRQVGTSGKKPHNNSGSSPKQNKSGPRANKNWAGNGNNMGGGFHHPLHQWYSLITPNWLSPSPPPYHQHPLLRSPAGKWNGHVSPQRYHWQSNNHHSSNHHHHHHHHHHNNKAAVKV